MINFHSYDSLGQSGMSLMQKAMSTANTAAERVSNSADPMDIAQTSMDMSEAKVQMAMGAFLVKSQNELMDTTLELLQPMGIGTKHSGLY
ncbi:MAG: hypothetical protein IJU98_06585 [Synergistaceae bacterium]|nr:hypothetical protein [Synergistaceae bacterium]